MGEFKATDAWYKRQEELEDDLPIASGPSVQVKCIECGNTYWVAHWLFINVPKCYFCKTNETK